MSFQWDMGYDRQTETDVPAGFKMVIFLSLWYTVDNILSICLTSKHLADLGLPLNGAMHALTCQTVTLNIWREDVCSYLLCLIFTIGKSALQTVDRE